MDYTRRNLISTLLRTGRHLPFGSGVRFAGAVSACILLSVVFLSNQTGCGGSNDDNSNSGDMNSNGAATTGPCESDTDCDDAAFCNGIEVCTNGLCTNGVSPCTAEQVCIDELDRCLETCTTDSDCADGSCQNGACMPPREPSNDLIGFATDESGASIDLASVLIVGERILLEAPAIITPAQNEPPPECGCAWSIDASTAGVFDNPDACSTGFTPASAGTAIITVDVSCNDALASFAQDVTIAESPPCQADTDCAMGQVCSNGVCITLPPAPSVTILTDQSRSPFVVRLDLRLLDATGQVIADGVTGQNFRIYENDVQLDLTETDLTVTPLPNLPMQVMLVLDYSQSMRLAGAIENMIEAAAGFITADHITATHRIGLVEFHDRSEEGVGFNLVSAPVRTDADGKGELVAAIPQPQALESGLSRVWDAVQLAIDTLAADEPQVGEVRAIVFLTDAKDTSSETAPDALITAASAAGIALYPIGFGDIGDQETILSEMAVQTGGMYFPAADRDALLGAFEQVALNLRGQWNVNYVTPRNTGSAPVRIEFDWDGLTGSVETNIDAGSLAGDVNQMLFEVAGRTYRDDIDATQFLVKLIYAPRNVDRFRFRFPHDHLTFELQSEGTVVSALAGWTQSITSTGVYEIGGPSAIALGGFGNVGTVVVPSDVPFLQIAHDDSIYANLAQPKTTLIEGQIGPGYNLTVTVSPEDSGTVQIIPDKPAYGHGDQVVLVPTPASGQQFDRWQGDATGDAPTLVLIMDSDKTISAVFTAVPPPAP